MVKLCSPLSQRVQNAIGKDELLISGIFNKDIIEKALEVTQFASLARTLLTQSAFITRINDGEELTSRGIYCNKCFEIFATKSKRCVFSPVLPKLAETFSTLRK